MALVALARAASPGRAEASRGEAQASVFDGKRNNGSRECRTQRIYAVHRREIDACRRFLPRVFRLWPELINHASSGMLIDTVHCGTAGFRRWVRRVTGVMIWKSARTGHLVSGFP